jgi:hypothetical protein
MANPRPDEKELAIFAVTQVRKFGGVLEHPAASTLWPVAGLPKPGMRDEFGGWTLPIHQHWWGHRAEKKTLLYIVGCEPKDIPSLPFRIDEASHVVSNGSTNHIQFGEPGWRPAISHKEREETPIDLAKWLVNLATKCKGYNK